MDSNVGKTDRVIRLVVGLAIIGAGVVMKSWWGAIGVIPLVTASVSYCPAYRLFGALTGRSSSQDSA